MTFKILETLFRQSAYHYYRYAIFVLYCMEESQIAQQYVIRPFNHYFDRVLPPDPHDREDSIFSLLTQLKNKQFYSALRQACIIAANILFLRKIIQPFEDRFAINPANKFFPIHTKTPIIGFLLSINIYLFTSSIKRVLSLAFRNFMPLDHPAAEEVDIPAEVSETVAKRFNYLCPILQEPLNDFVLGNDGYLYERRAILRWLETHDTSPMSRANMTPANLSKPTGLRVILNQKLSR